MADVSPSTNDYAPDSGSILLDAFTAADNVYSFDLFGTATDGAIGGIQVYTATASSERMTAEQYLNLLQRFGP